MMKMLSRILSLLLLTSLGLFYAGCGPKDDKEDPAEKVQLAKLEKKQWTIQSVTHDAAPVTTFNGAKLTISGTYAENGTYQYAFAGTMPATASPWPRSGTWKFVSAATATTQILRLDDNISMTYAVTDSQLTISFNFTGTGYNTRGQEVEGAWVFTFN